MDDDGLVDKEKVNEDLGRCLAIQMWSGVAYLGRYWNEKKEIEGPALGCSG